MESKEAKRRRLPLSLMVRSATGTRQSRTRSANVATGRVVANDVDNVDENDGDDDDDDDVEEDGDGDDVGIIRRPV